MPYLFLLAAALSLIAAPASARADAIDRVVADQMAVSRIPGAAVAVVERGRVVKLAAYGVADVEWNAPVDLDTRFQLASATKIFTGVLLMRLVGRGRLDLDDPLTRWFPDAPPSWAGIRVRQLADHTSGLPDDLGTPAPQTVEGVVAAAMKRPLAYQPGTEARYGFTDFTVLRAVIEKAGGKKLPDLLRDEVTAPLGMTATGFALAAEEDGVRVGAVLPKRAETYGLRDGELVTSDFFFAPHGYGAGGLYSSIRDLAAFFAALDQGRVLRRESLVALETPATLSGGRRSGFGVGWVARTYRGVPVVGHSGGPALADILRVEDRRLTVIALTNQRTFFPLLAEALLDRYVPAPPEPAAIEDRTPQSTARVRAALEAAAAGRPATGVSPNVAGQLGSPFARALLNGVGPLHSFSLIGEEGSTRRYRATFRRKRTTWLAESDAQGVITRLRPE
ncbi:serine hydrolase domain-containing protein [Sphingomonas lenta]|uniref:Beta-lactamase-related domain-containing protein n=1 Tax=Sphingomonas lenta TaxID=1141887 RepID=A0A2A2SCZ9_9SPHN|nr:serine hydrolase domain-containing protein [Sphingomonas lenta]PAX06881.1 hypothetical protein CKY28_12455 [Sphingomonas lenta]